MVKCNSSVTLSLIIFNLTYGYLDNNNKHYIIGLFAEDYC